MASLQDLLPDPDSSVLCADFARSIALDPGGSAIRADRVVLIETPLPWPKPIFDHPLLAEVKPVFDASNTITRVLASVPETAHLDRDRVSNDAVSDVDGSTTEDAGKNVTVIVFDRNARGHNAELTAATDLAPEPASSVDEYRYNVPVGSLLALAESLAAHPIDAELPEDLKESLQSKGKVESPILIVCTQGSHDICCGSQGMRFANNAQGLANVTVHKVSHTGGHRFAPTAMTLPDGRMWADLNVEKLEKIIAQSGDTAELSRFCRGWWGAQRGAAQVAERAVFAEVGWILNAQHRSVEISVEPVEDDPSKQQQWQVSVGEQRWEVAISVGRDVPTIACHSPGGLPAKPAVEYRVDSLRQLT